MKHHDQPVTAEDAHALRRAAEEHLMKSINALRKANLIERALRRGDAITRAELQTLRQCRRCEQFFTMDGGELRWFRERNLECPRVCKACRALTKTAPIADQLSALAATLEERIDRVEEKLR
jgi:hypothetical protein